MINLNGMTSWYGPNGLFNALFMLADWMDDAVDYHGPGGWDPTTTPTTAARPSPCGGRGLARARVSCTHGHAAYVRLDSPEANLARRIALAYLSRRCTSLLNRQTFGEGVERTAALVEGGARSPWVALGSAADCQ